MNHHPVPMEQSELISPARNNFFNGKMMNVFAFQMEQAYFNRMRRLLNRTGLGAGVLCGLDVTATEDNACLWLHPGVAIDGYGREIIVPAPFCIENPRQPTDEHGRPSGDPIEGEGAMTLVLCYHECLAEPLPVMVSNCDTHQNCAPGTIRERYLLRLVPGVPESRPVGLTEEQCNAIFPEDPPDDFDRRVTACETLSGECILPDEDCVVLATIQLPATAADPITVDTCAFRPTLYSNARLFGLLLCLSERVDACCSHLQLRYVSGDAQQGEPEVELADPLVVEVVDGAGNPVENETVAFNVRGGGGSLAPTEVATGADGRAETRWTLGPNPGLNTMAASIAGQPELPLFALAVAAEESPVTRAPVVTQMWPDYARTVVRGDGDFERWFERPLLALTFDRDMDRQLLEETERWIRVSQFLQRDGTFVRPVRIGLVDVTNNFPGRTGFTAVFEMRVEDREQPARYLVQIRADAGNVTDTSTPPLTLDAEFAGTRLSANVQNQIWDLTEDRSFPASAWNALADTGVSLPRSGDGAEGGSFHAWFGVTTQS